MDSGLDIIANGRKSELGEAAIEQRNNHGSGTLNAVLYIQALLFMVNDRFPHPKIILTHADNRKHTGGCDSVSTVNHNEVRSDVSPMDLLLEVAILASHSI